MYLFEIPEYRSEAMKKIATNQKIKNLLTNKTDSTDTPDSLINQYIFPYWKIPGTTTEQKTVVIMNMRVPRVENKTFKQIVVEFGILCPVSLIPCVDPSTGKNRLRFDLIAHEIDKMFNGTSDIGFKLELVSMSDYSLTDIGFHGVVLRYSTDDFNR